MGKLKQPPSIGGSNRRVTDREYSQTRLPIDAESREMKVIHERLSSGEEVKTRRPDKTVVWKKGK